MSVHKSWHCLWLFWGLCHHLGGHPSLWVGSFIGGWSSSFVGGWLHLWVVSFILRPVVVAGWLWVVIGLLTSGGGGGGCLLPFIDVGMHCHSWMVVVGPHGSWWVLITIC